MHEILGVQDERKPKKKLLVDLVTIGVQTNAAVTVWSEIAFFKWKFRFLQKNSIVSLS